MGVILVAESPFPVEEIKLFYQLLKFGAFSTFQQANHLKVIARFDHRKSDRPGAFGSYNRYWKTIQIFGQDADPFTKGLTLIHEAFHAWTLEDPVRFKNFLDEMGWISKTDILSGTIYRFDDLEGTKFEVTEADVQLNPKGTAENIKENVSDHPFFPTDYSYLGPFEMFAEAGVAATLIDQDYDSYPGFRLNSFKNSRAHNLVKKFLQRD